MKSILNIFFKTKGTRPFPVLGCLLVAGLAQGLGIASLVPIISIVLDDGGAPANPAVEAFHRFFEFLGLELNLASLLIFAVATVIFKNILNLTAMTYVGYAVAQIASDLRLNLVRNLLAVRWSFFTKHPLGKTTNLISGQAARASRAYLTSATFIASAIQAVVYVIVAFFVSWQVAVLALVVGAAIAGALSFLIRRARQAGKNQTIYKRQLVIYLSDTLNNIKPLKAMNRQQDFAEVLERNIMKVRKALRKQAFATQALSSANEVLGTVTVAVGFALAVGYFGFQPAELLVMGLLLSRLLKTLSKLQSQYQQSAALQTAYEYIMDEIARTEEQRENDTSEETATFEDSIRFEHVTFSYPGSPILHNVSLVFKKFETTVLTGPSGSGKTTITDLVLGFYKPDTGQVLIDDRPLQSFSLSAWRSTIGYVPQEPILFRDTIFTNVTLGDKSIGEEEVKRALELGGALDFVEKMPKGIYSEVGEKGGRMSGGQRQRIAIARALVRNPDLLILDEVTSALDPESEKAIVRNISGLNGKVTVIAITHRPAFLEIADQVYHLDAGHIAKQTNHQRVERAHVH